jgi:glycine/D-amino acid oxidase-like deaminating enzyme
MRNDPRSHGLWEASAPPPPSTKPLTEDISVDVVVVGAGFTGLSAALHLAQGGASVAVLEAVEIGFGGSGRNVGLVNAGMWVTPAALPGELGDKYGARLLDKLGNGPSLVFDLVQRYSMDCQAVRNGTLHCAVGAAGLSDITERAKQWQALGAPVHLLDAKETARKTGTHAYSGALLDLRAGTIQPLAYARGLASAAVSAGARLYTNSPVIAVEDSGTQWCLRTSNGGSVTAKWVIVATNAYTCADGVWSQLDTELVRLPYFNMATPPLSNDLRQSILPERQGAWDTRQVMSSFRFDQAGRLVFGSVGALRGSGRTIHRDWGRRAMTKLFPQLKGVEFEHEWYGWIGMTPNALPRFHRLARNTISFSGYNGRGIAPGTVFGRELARLALAEISEEELPLPVSPIVPTHFRAAKEAFYEVGSQIAHATGARF